MPINSENREKPINEKKLVEDILQSIGDAFVIIDSDWRYTFINKNLARIFQDQRYSEDMIGKVVWDVIPELKGTVMEKFYRDAMQKRQPAVFDAKSLVAPVWVEVRVFPYLDGIAIFFRDITDRKNDHENLKKSEERFSMIFNSSAAAQSITDFATGKIIDVNESYVELLGYERKELLGKTINEIGIYDYAPPGERSKVLKMIRKKRRVQQYEIIFRKKSGAPLNVLFSAEQIDLQGDNLIITSLLDITEKKKAQEELKQLNDLLEEKVRSKTLELTNSLEREKAINDVKSQFVSMASHEFRTPLATILSSLALLEKYAGDECGDKMVKHFTRIRNSVDNLTEILNDFLSFEKMEKGKTVTINHVFDMKDMITRFIEEYRPNLKAGQSINYLHHGDTELFQDRNIIINSLTNLLSNASKYSGNNAAIDIISFVKDGTAGIKVKDRGMGIPDKDKENIFTLFFRANNAEAIQGTGLGLIIVKKYMELLGGNISFESKENEGSVFALNFPSNARLF